MWKGEPTVHDPADPAKLYMRIMYRDWFFGPYDDENELLAACLRLDKAAPYWDYDCVAFMYGADPLPDDYVHGFKFLEQDKAVVIRNRTAK